MRTLSPYLVLIALLFVITSCSVDQESVIENDPSNFSIETTDVDNISTQTGQRFYDTSPLSQESIDLERGMQWASYIAAYTLMHYPEAKEDFIDKKGPRRYVSLSNVIGLDTSNPANEFQNTYKEILIDFITIVLEEEDNQKSSNNRFEASDLPENCRPETASNIPPPPLGPNGQNGAPELENPIPVEEEAEIIATNFINYILQNNCLEFFFPLNINDNDFSQISSTAHPLTSSDSNTAIARNRSSVFPGNTCHNQMTTLEYIISSNYTPATDEIIIVTRPKTSVNPNPDCVYQYDINFSQFLN
ncbi:hypothetical protein [uncultured Dokdonia sp.]|uniref:hypothetical protein n=1 Tax=uncultured Dokdonia sp. TaxID=575653 RepID=UPI00261284CA|nr:hypothetical protein [uncultured Dokdonia sp.]